MIISEGERKKLSKEVAKLFSKRIQGDGAGKLLSFTRS